MSGGSQWSSGPTSCSKYAHVRRASVLGLYRLDFRDSSIVLEAQRGEPVYLFLAMGSDKVLRFKPQNLVTGLPLRALETVT